MRGCAGRRLKCRLFDVSNIDGDGQLLQPGSVRWILGKGNQLFHVDSSFNPRRAGLVGRGAAGIC